MRQVFVLRLVLIGAVLLLCGSKAYAQTEIIDFMGRPVMVKQYLDVKGSPYLDDAWQEGWVKSILEQQNYYLADRNGKLTKLKKDRRSLLQALGVKQTELEQYTRTNRLDLRKEQDMTKLVMYYNSL